MKKILKTLMAAMILMTALSGQAFGDEPTGVQVELDSQLAERPGGQVVGSTIVYTDGTVFVAVDSGTMSLSQCTSNKFCIWDLSSYRGSFLYKTGDGSTYSISGTVGSFWNNRTKVARLYNNSGSGYTCYENGVQKSSVSSSYSSAAKVYLSTSTAC